MTTAGTHPPTVTSAVITIARVDLARLARDPVALFFIVVLPVVIMLLIGATFGAQSQRTTVGIVDLDHSAASAELTAALRAGDLLDVPAYATEAELRQDVRIQNLPGGVVIPSGFGATLDRGEVAVVTLVADQKQNAAVTLANLVGNVIDRDGEVLAAARFAAAHGAGEGRSLVESARVVQARIQPVGIEVETTGRASLTNVNRYAYTAPSNLVLFVFINSITGATALVESRRLGVTRRMLAAPISARTIMLGAGVTRLLLALLQSLLILLVGTFVFGVSWGDPVAVAVLVLVFALLATGAGLLIGSLVQKPEQVPSLGIPISMGMAMLGGCMWPLEIVGPALRTAGHLTPHAWAMDAWISLGFEGGGLGTIAVDLLVLAAVAAVLIVLATWRLHRTLIE